MIPREDKLTWEASGSERCKRWTLMDTMELSSPTSFFGQGTYPPAAGYIRCWGLTPVCLPENSPQPPETDSPRVQSMVDKNNEGKTSLACYAPFRMTLKGHPALRSTWNLLKPQWQPYHRSASPLPKPAFLTPLEALPWELSTSEPITRESYQRKQFSSPSL